MARKLIIGILKLVNIIYCTLPTYLNHVIFINTLKSLSYEHWQQTGHIGASWTEGGKWKCGKFSILGASNEKIFFFRIVLFGHSLSFKMTYWNYM